MVQKQKSSSKKYQERSVSERIKRIRDLRGKSEMQFPDRSDKWREFSQWADAWKNK